MSNLTSTTSSSSPFPHTHRPVSILLPLFTHFNTLDVNGPIEVLSQANRNSQSSTTTTTNSTPPFQITIASSTPLTTSIEHVSIARDISIRDAIERLKEWDVLLIPGGTEVAILGMIEVWKAGKENGGKGKSDNDGEGNGSEFLKLLDAWMGDGDSGKGKLTLTVCTGSLFPGALGKLGGRRVTTHWRSLGTLKRLCEEVETGKSSDKAEIIRARWIESGNPSKDGKSWLITAGGVSCGLDATFHLLDRTVGTDVATVVADVLEYQRRGMEVHGDV